MLRENDPADFIVINNPADFEILETYIDGNLVAKDGTSFIPTSPERIVNNFDIDFKDAADFKIQLANTKVKVIEVIDGQLITQTHIGNILLDAEGNAVSNIQEDILKVAVINRYYDAPVAVAFIKNFGLKEGALASSVAHDSHNIIVVGADDESMSKAANAIIQERGGLSVTDGETTEILGLPVAGLMSIDSCEVVGEKYTELVRFAKEIGCTLHSPFMSLSFMALLVIPQLKLSDKGLFDGEKFEFSPLEIV